jgi:hypothetical protein
MPNEVLIPQVCDLLHLQWYNSDSRKPLEELGCRITGKQDAYYKVILPAGWTVEDYGNIAFIKDSHGVTRAKETGVFDPKGRTLMID